MMTLRSGGERTWTMGKRLLSDSSTSALSVAASDSFEGAHGDKRSSRGFQSLPQFYRGNHGEVSPIRVRPLFMTRYLFPERDSDAVKETLEDHDNDEEHGLTAPSQPEIRRNRTSDPDFASKENREASYKRRSSATTDKSLYSHVMHRVKNMGNENCRRSSLAGDFPSTRLSRSSQDPQQHATD